MRSEQRCKSLAIWAFLALLGMSSRPADAVVITEYPITSETALPDGITRGPDGNVWFTERSLSQAINGNRKIGKISPAGNITEYSFGSVGGVPQPGGTLDIASGPDGNLWFTDQSSGDIGRITTSGQVSHFSMSLSANPTSIVAGADGNLWFTEQTASRIGRITTAGVITEFVIPEAFSYPVGIAAGSDGNLWFTEQGTYAIERITPSGVFTQFPLPQLENDVASPIDIASGPDGNLWVTESGCYYCSPRSNGSRIAKVTMAGVVTYYQTPTPVAGPNGITVGPDGALWFTEISANKIGRITTAGAITEFPIPTANSGATEISAGPDGRVWFTELTVNKIAAIGAIVADAAPTSAPIDARWALVLLVILLMLTAFMRRRL